MQLDKRWEDFDKRCLKNVEFLLVVDLEATCCNKGTIPRDEMETIEVGVSVLRRSMNWEEEFSYSIFIKPTLHPTLSDFCKGLTHISQEQVDQGMPYAQALDVLTKLTDTLGDSWAWCSWGAYDRNQLIQDGKLHGLNPLLPSDRHFNLKVYFSSLRGVKRQFGLSNALKSVGYEFVGQPHRAYSDAFNTGRLFKWLMNQRQ